MVARQTDDWRRVVTASDARRLRDWRSTFVAALAQARAAGHGQAIEREGELLKPDAALGGPIPDGAYRCRVIKVGAKSAGMLDYIAYPAFACAVHSKDRRHFLIKRTGSQRQSGIIFPGGPLRDVFLGTLVLGDEQRAFQYGVDESRDVAAYVERIGARRWRLLLPEPRYESQLDVLELIPAPQE